MLDPAVRHIFFSGRPGWLSPLVARAGGAVPSLVLDFANNRSFVKGMGQPSIPSILSVTNANGTIENLAGLVLPGGANAPSYNNRGLSATEARTNVVLHSRDLTNAAWVKTDCTAAKDQVGTDGVANSASSLTATSNGGTCLQSITLASSARFQFARIKRLVGTGTLEMTMDNGGTWTDITSSVVSGSYTKISIPTQTIANPIVGFRIGTSGDSFAIDRVNNQNGAFGALLPDIDTTTTAVTKTIDNVSLTAAAQAAAGLSLAQGTWYVEWTQSIAGADSAGDAVLYAMFVDSNNNNRMRNIQASSDKVVASGAAAGSTTWAPSSTNAPAVATAYKAACAYAADNVALRLSASLGADPANDTSATMTTGAFTTYFGNQSGGSSANSLIPLIAWFPPRLGDGILNGMRA